MFKGTILSVPRTEAIRSAAEYLRQIGLTVTESCAPDVTHLLLPVPSFPQGDTYLAHLLAKLPEDIVVVGGNLNSPLLEEYTTIDLLHDPDYLASNAAITAQCTMEILESRTADTLQEKKVLVIGWGRIGKCLGQKLHTRCIATAIAARKSEDLAMIHALGHESISTEDLPEETGRFDIIINTVPELLLPNIQAKPDSVIIELASKPGITGANIIQARGLPGKMAPAVSGKLIAKTFIRLAIS